MYPQFIDNDRKTLADTLRMVAPAHEILNIATGYWDVPGTLEIIDHIKDYDKVRILIGKEPLAHRLQVKYCIDPEAPENIFPEADIKHDLVENAKTAEINDLRRTVMILSRMQKEGRLEIRIFREPLLHAKAYIFGDLYSSNAVGIVGSSNFTRAGLTRNAELNYLEDDSQKVTYAPRHESQENGHIIWFKNLWDQATEWTGEFSEILANSPLGEATYGPYDVYIKTLMEIFPEELINPKPFDDYVKEYLHPFQNQNALALRRKLHVNGVAMLSDSVGLGKTVTAASIIDQYIKEGKDNIVLILPASLQNQWIEELEGDPWNMRHGKDFTIYSQENINRIEEAILKSYTKKAYESEVNLFVIDEAHNLRNVQGRRYHAVLEFLQANPSSEVLLLTATPINNSLMDFVAQIQLGSKGELSSYQVKYKSRPDAQAERIDFFEAAKRIQNQHNRSKRDNVKFDWEFYKPTLVSGIRHYLVRSTRQGVVKRQAMKDMSERENVFPENKVVQFSYKYSNKETSIIDDNIGKSIFTVFEGIDPRELNILLMMDITQRTEHPLDIIKNISKLQQETEHEEAARYYKIEDDQKYSSILLDYAEETTVIGTIYKLINLLGFVPYRPHVYSNDFHAKSMEEVNLIIDNYDEESSSIRLEFSVHNILQTTWLKRLESSTASLLKSINYYSNNLNKFSDWIDQGYVVKLSDIETLIEEYESNATQAMADRQKYLDELDEAIKTGTEDKVETKGARINILDPSVYAVDKFKEDIERDKAIVKVLQTTLGEISKPEHDAKLHNFLDNLVSTLNTQKYGKKAIVFSFFADTIDYLENTMPEIVGDKIPDFEKRSAFISGQSSNTKLIAQLFSPKSQKYTLKRGDTEIDYLFSTDVLSEGQNLQDAGILINYDLHWNPVRMIQRNGRINRIGSSYDEVLIANARPHDELEQYLKLVNRLESKIDGITHTIGSDSSVLGEDINPIEFSDKVEEAYGIYSTDSEEASAAMKNLDAEDSVIDWIDDYSMELRQFLDDNPDKKEYIEKIPAGKWNYLPRKESNEDKAFGLFKEYGRNVATGEKLTNSVFIEYDKSPATNIFAVKAGVRASTVADEDVLEHIRTTPDDNRRKQDTIDLNRANYLLTGIQETETNLNTQQQFFKVEPRHEKALLELNDYLNVNDIKGLASRKITTINEKQHFNRIAYDVNQEMKKYGRLNLSLVHKASDFFLKLEEKESHNNVTDSVEGVLFYVSE